MEELLEKLNRLWFSSEDPRYNGENPACEHVWEAIEKEFSNMSDEEIKGILDTLPSERMEQLLPVFEDMADEREFLKDYYSL